MKVEFCGPPRAGLLQWLGRPRLSTPAAWFPGRTWFFHRARIGIRLACDMLGLTHGDEVLAPAYNCGTEIDALLSSGADVTLYRVTRDGNVDLDDLRTRVRARTKAVYVTHYFGFPQRMDEIVDLCERHHLYLMEDCALALCSRSGEKPLGTWGDVAFFCLWKSLPVPDGGVLVVNNEDLTPPREIPKRSSLGRTWRSMLSLLKWQFLYAVCVRLGLYPVIEPVVRTWMPPSSDEHPGPGREPMPESYYYSSALSGVAISSLSTRILQTVNKSEVVDRRRRNFALYLALLSGKTGIDVMYSDLPDGVCPLYFPILIQNRSDVCKALCEKTVLAKKWWSGYHSAMPWDEYSDACYLKDHLLALPVHQHLSENHIRYTAELLLEVTDRFRNERGVS